MRKYIILSALSVLAGSVVAQTEYDALRFSQTYIQGSARSAAMGGAFGALGGDASVLAINPAGIGVYNVPDFGLTLDFAANDTKITPASGNNEASKYALKISNLSFMIPHDNGNSSGLTGWTFGVAYNRLADFSIKENYNYINNAHSMLDSWCDNAYGLPENTVKDFNGGLGFNAGLGYETYLLDHTKDGVNEYCNPHMNSWSGLEGAYGERQRRNLETKGGINTWDFAVATSFNHKLFLGASLGIQTVNYKATSTYSEDDEQDAVPYEYWDFVEKNEVNGTGANFKIGLLAKPFSWFNFGISAHTPTFYTIHDKYYTKVRAQYDAGTFDDGVDYYDAISTDNSYDYRLTTPFKYVLSAAIIAPSFTILSFDYEYLDYSKCELNDEEFNDYDFYAQNEACKEKFQGVNNMRVGIEQCVQNLSFRAGYQLHGNPYKFMSGDKQRQIISAGFGIKHRNSSDNIIYLDVSGTYHIYQTDGFIYESSDAQHSQRVSFDNRYLNIMLTLGIRFN